MDTLKDEVNSGISLFLDKQREVPGECTVSIYEFNTTVTKLVDFSPLTLVNNPKIEPRGMTALYDAIGTAFTKTGEKLASMHEFERPERVLVSIVTDGEENSSRLFNCEKVQNMIKEQRSKYLWQIDFFGCSEACMKNARTIGVSSGFQYTYDSSPIGVSVAFNKMSDVKSLLRSCSQEQYTSSVIDGEV